MIAPHRDHNARGEFVCKDGYKLIGSTYTYCYFGKWITKTTPVCQEGMFSWWTLSTGQKILKN